MADDNRFSTRIGMSVKDYFWFSKGVFFTFGSFFSLAVVQYAFLGYMFVFIQKNQDDLRTAALITNVFECVSPFLDSFLVRPSFRLMPYLITNVITDASFVAGILMLWFTGPNWSNGIFYSAFALLVVGRTGDMFTYRLLFHYIRSEDDKDNVRKVYERTDVWRSIARCPGAILGLSISEFDWKPIMKISAMVTIIGFVFLVCGILHYNCQRKGRNPGRGEALALSQENNQSSQKCSSIMQLLKLFPLYIPFLIYYVVEGAGDTFFYEQADQLHDHIGKIFFSPAASLYAIQKGSGLMTSLLMEILNITKLWPKGRWQCAKLILGMVFCFLCCMCSWHVESQRLDSTPSMSNLWMVPQFVLLGITKQLVEDGMEDVFFSRLKNSVHLWVSAFLCVVKGLGVSLAAVLTVVLGKWIRKKIAESRLDKYYFLLAMLSVLAILFLMRLRKFYAPKIEPEKNDEELGMNPIGSERCLDPTESPAESTSLRSGNNKAGLLLHSRSDTAGSPSSNSLVPQHFHSHSETKEEMTKDNDEKMGEVKADSVPQPSANYSIDESSPASNLEQEPLLSLNLDITKSSSNDNWSVVKRSFSYPHDQPRPAANVQYKRFHTHPKTNEGEKEDRRGKMKEHNAE